MKKSIGWAYAFARHYRGWLALVAIAACLIALSNLAFSACIQLLISIGTGEAHVRLSMAVAATIVTVAVMAALEVLMSYARQHAINGSALRIKTFLINHL